MANLSFTYETIIAAIQAWVTDTDVAFTSQLPTIVNLGELRLVRDLNLEIFDTTDAASSTAIGSRSVAKPATCVVLRDVGITTATGYKTLERRSITYCKYFAPDPAAQAEPQFFSEEANTIYIVPTPDAVYVVQQYMNARPVDGLTPSPGNVASWLSSRVPDALFAACLMEAEQFIKADDRYADFQSKYYNELLPVARLELRNCIRNGDRAPMKAGPSAQ